MLEIRELSVKTGVSKTKEIVESVSFQLPKGKSYALVGRSGSGKSTVLHSILQLLPSDFWVQGEISYEGSNLLHWNEKQMRAIRGKRIGFVFQNCLNSFDPLFSVGHQIEEAFKLYFPKIKKSERKEKILNLFEKVGLDGNSVWKAFPHELSGGMIQRAAIAMALSGSPELLLADELTSALDKKLQWQVLDTLHALVKEINFSLLWVTHDLKLAEKYADRILVMKEGRCRENS